MTKHPLAGKTVKLNCKSDPDELNGKEYRIEDWWINLGQGSWMVGKGNPACIKYAIRAGLDGLPTDDKVLYGKVGCYGHLIHESELGNVIVETK